MKNILLTLLALLMLIGFGYVVTSPTLTEEAAERHMNLESPYDTEEDEGDDAYDFL
ncbi:MAG: hypothetical protein IJE07_13295 [Clostridia bacterium]|nr:hypothetical protein [Clostridia bacterium]